MKILSPINKLEEITPLIVAGADEFYCAVVINNIDLSCPRGDDKYKSNISSLKEFERLVQVVRKNRKKIYVALNMPDNNKEQIRIAIDYIDRLRITGADGIIVGNISLLNILKNYGTKLIASSLLEAKNVETVRLLTEHFEVERIILDRQVTAEDLREITKMFPKTEFEVFILEAPCRSLNSWCRWWRLAMQQNLSDLHTYCSCSPTAFSNNNWCGKTFSAADLFERIRQPRKGCGVCALPFFMELGIASVKIVGRELPTSEARICNVRFIKHAMEAAASGERGTKLRTRMQKLFRKYFGFACGGHACYYPHLIEN